MCGVRQWRARQRRGRLWHARRITEAAGRRCRGKRPADLGAADELCQGSLAPVPRRSIWHCKWAMAPGSVTGVAVRIGEALRPGPAGGRWEASPDPRDDGVCDLVHFMVESEEELCAQCNVAVPSGNMVWACEACLYIHCCECGPVRKWGHCPGPELCAEADEVVAPPDSDRDVELIMPPAGAKGEGEPCGWARAQVNTAAGAHCSSCNTHRKKGSRMDRCATCRTWCCSSHPLNTRRVCRATAAGTSSVGTRQPCLAELWRTADVGPGLPEAGGVLTLEESLLRMAAEPGPRTLLWVPRSLEARVADLMVSCIDLAVTSLEQVSGGDLPSEAAVQANLLLRALPELLLRVPPEHGGRNRNAAAVSADLRLAAVLRARVDQAELQDWTALAADALADRQATRCVDAGREAMASDTGATDSPAAFAATAQLVAGKVHSGCVKSALQILTGNGKALSNEATWRKIEALVAEAAPSGEADATLAAATAALSQMGVRAPCRIRTVKRRLRVMRPGAEPGPSGWRNSHLALVGRRPAGAECLARWCRTWAQSTWPAECASAWTQAIIVPLNKDTEGIGVRPIALGEALLKLAEAIAVDETAPALRAFLEPAQVAVRTPGGAELVAHMVRTWTQEHPEHALVQVDLRNAYGVPCAAPCFARRPPMPPRLPM